MPLRRRHFPRARWTAGQERAFQKAHLAGKEEAVSAQKVGRTTDAAKAKRDRMRLPRNPNDPRQSEMLEICNLSREHTSETSNGE